MSGPEKPDAPANGGRPSLARAFWLWYLVAGGALVCLPFTMHAASADLPFAVVVVWMVAAPCYLLFASGLVWVRGRRAHPVARILSRLFVIGVLVAIATFVITPHDYGSSLRWKVLDGTSLSAPHRTALGIACSDGTLRAGQTNSDLDLLAPAGYRSEVVRSVAAGVTDETTVTVTIVYEAIGGKVAGGATVVYTGTCTPGGMTWRVGGTMPEKYRPKT